MTDKIVNLFTGQSSGAPIPELVTCIEGLLVQAKTGELQSIAFAGQCSDGAMQTGFTSSSDVFSIIGALRLVEHRLIEEVE